jgi:hypothetical protein
VTCHTPREINCAKKYSCAKNSETADNTERTSFLPWLVYRRFVAGLSKIAAPLNILLRKGENPQLNYLSEEQLAAFETLRTRLLDPPILALPRAEGLFT